MTAERAVPGSCIPHMALHDDGRNLRQEAIAFQVGALNLSTPSSMQTFPVNNGLHCVDSGASSQAASNEEYLETLSPGGYGSGVAWRHPFPLLAMRNDPTGSIGVSNETRLERNPMWGSGVYQAGAESYGLGRNGNDGSATGGTSSLSSSRSLPELGWTSGDAWVSRDGTGWLNGDQDDLSLYQQREERQYIQSAGTGVSSMASMSSTPGPIAYTNASPQALSMDRSSRSTTQDGNDIQEGNLGGTRMEEGSIGSKRRVWYRAPNGQFTSATQLQSGRLAGNGNESGESTAGAGQGIRRIRRRRKSEEVDRKYRCDFDGCDKAYGTLNREWNVTDAWRC